MNKYFKIMLILILQLPIIFSMNSSVFGQTSSGDITNSSSSGGTVLSLLERIKESLSGLTAAQKDLSQNPNEKANVLARKIKVIVRKTNIALNLKGDKCVNKLKVLVDEIGRLAMQFLTPPCGSPPFRDKGKNPGIDCIPPPTRLSADEVASKLFELQSLIQEAIDASSGDSGTGVCNKK